MDFNSFLEIFYFGCAEALTAMENLDSCKESLRKEEEVRVQRFQRLAASLGPTEAPGAGSLGPQWAPDAGTCDSCSEESSPAEAPEKQQDAQPRRFPGQAQGEGRACREGGLSQPWDVV